MRAAGWAAAGMVGLAAGAWAAVAFPVGPLDGQAPTVCASHRALVASLDLTSLADQAEVRVRAAVLADALRAQGGAAQLQVADRVADLLGRPYATTADLRDAVAEVSRACAPRAARAPRAPRTARD